MGTTAARRLVPFTLVLLGLLLLTVIFHQTSVVSIYYYGRGFESTESNSKPSMGPRETESELAELVNVTVNTDNIPAFMKEYFRWHGKQLLRIQQDAQNANGEDLSFLKNYRFVVLRCVGNDRCGGLSDRLKGFPLFLWYAATTDRILLIRWGDNRPAPIETFLQPGSFWNWTVPNVLSQKLNRMESTTDTTISMDSTEFQRLYFHGVQRESVVMDKLKDPKLWMVEGNHYDGKTTYSQLVNAAIEANEDEIKRSSSPSSSVSFSNLQPRDAEFRNFYHDLFHATFRPSSRVSELLGAFFYAPKTNTEADAVPRSWLPVPLQPNRYVVSQFRAAYPGEPYRTNGNKTILRETTIHAVECAKARVEFSRGNSTNGAVSAVYVTSDTALVIEAAHDAYQGHAKKHEPADSDHVFTYLDLVTYDTESTGDNGHVQTKHAITLAEDPPHLNFAKPEDVSAFYVIFADLFVMSYANCVVYGAGGFGRMGSLVSYQPFCGTAFTADEGILQDCKPYGG